VALIEKEGAAGSRMSCRVFSVLGLLVLASIAFAQQQTHFEVTSVKPNTSREMPALEFSPSGSLHIRNAPLLMLLAGAWNLPFQSDRLKGLPGWVSSDRFDIDATAPKDAFPAGLLSKVREERTRQMLQALFADRLKLVMRSEMKVVPVYAVVVAKGGPKLERAKIEEKDCDEGGLGAYSPATENSCHTFTGGRGRGLHGQAITIGDMALAVSNWADRPVVDKTGLTGLFHIETAPWLPMNPGPPPAEGAKGEDGSLLADMPTLPGIFERLGLKLESDKAPIEMFTIERIEKPDAN
jgi:uncharacterized protein (TIGR03435 family)